MEIKIRERENIVILDIIGDLLKSTPNVGDLHQCVRDQLDVGKRNFIINLENAGYIDTFGAAEMLTCVVSVSNMGGKLKFCPLKYWLKHKWQIGTGCEPFEDEEEAIKKFSG